MITILAGGTGSAKLVRGMSKVTSEELTIIVNVGDNITINGLYICPDIDTILYVLSNYLDNKKGWGVKEDTFNFLEQASKFGLEKWFKIGDKDLAIHFIRTNLIRKGHSLSEATNIISKKLKISQKIIPASNQKIETMIQTDKRNMHLQEFWVKFKGEPEVKKIKYESPREAQAAPGVLNAIHNSSRIIICPANPITSIGPILFIPEIRRALQNEKNRVIAVSPIKGNRPFSGPAGKFMKTLEISVSPLGIAMYYSDVIGELIIDINDIEYLDRINEVGVSAIPTNILMENYEDEKNLSNFILNL